ncbi:S8 family serine peptidase [Oceanobacillus sp. CF4.6]|uniref:S8 family serine peptidase n=1 Tax=Oceanobacillus sp. CF4.6 TaxID=3373080 RepID=UPI003EE801B2
MSKPKLCSRFLLFVIFFVLFIPLNAFASSEVEAIIGYENEAGKQLIIETSSEIDYEFTNISAVAVTMNSRDLTGLYGNSNISYIEKNTAFELSNKIQTITEVTETDILEETEHWNILTTGAAFAWEEGFTGKNVNIAIIDTGISPHEDLLISGGHSTVDDTGEWLDDNGHGMHIAGIIGAKKNDIGVVGVAPEANLYAVKALDSNGEGTLTDLLEAIEWSINNNMDIINLSLGTDESSESLENMLQEAYDAGILIVGASGNDGNSVAHPAKYESVIGVSAVDGRLNITGFSSTGAEVEFSAPGINIISTYLYDSYGTSSGTSQASPHVTGMLAILKQKYPEMTNYEIRAELVKHVQDLGDSGRDSIYGHGFITYNPDDQIAPGEVTNLQLIESSADSLLVSWENPVDEDFTEVSVYLNDSFLTSVTRDEETTYLAEELEADTEYSFSFYTEDRFGNVSVGKFFETRTKVGEPVSNEEEAPDEKAEVVVSEDKTDKGRIESEEADLNQNTAEEKENDQVAVEPGEEDNADLNREETEQAGNEEQAEKQLDEGSQGNEVKDDPEESQSQKASAIEKTEESNRQDIASAVDADKINASLNSDKENDNGSEPKKNDTEQEDEAIADSDEDLAPDEKEDESKNIFVRFFEYIGNLFITIFDWIIGLFT